MMTRESPAVTETDLREFVFIGVVCVVRMGDSIGHVLAHTNTCE